MCIIAVVLALFSIYLFIYFNFPHLRVPPPQMSRDYTRVMYLLVLELRGPLSLVRKSHNIIVPHVS